MPRRALWERSAGLRGLLRSLRRSCRPFRASTTPLPPPRPALSFSVVGGPGLAWAAGVRGALAASRMRRGLVYPKGQRCPCPALPMGPAAGRPVVRSEARSDGAGWREKDARRKARLGRGPRGTTRPLSAPPPPAADPAPPRPAAARMRRALRPLPPRAALLPWQPRRDGGGAGWARTGRGGRRLRRPRGRCWRVRLPSASPHGSSTPLRAQRTEPPAMDSQKVSEGGRRGAAEVGGGGRGGAGARARGAAARARLRAPRPP